jgi:hypothetical protein
MSITETTSDSAMDTAIHIVATLWPNAMDADAPQPKALRQLCSMIAVAIDAEREACAQIAVNVPARHPDDVAWVAQQVIRKQIVAEIRARGGAGGAA